ncbi:acyl-CoA desaturase, partial [Xanthomonas perforans]|nr:acyl-CoA desaturase [Xanthomonas perforans]
MPSTGLDPHAAAPQPATAPPRGGLAARVGSLRRWVDSQADEPLDHG